jgi:pyrroline-5-carboxylate reductase
MRPNSMALDRKTFSAAVERAIHAAYRRATEVSI